MPDDPKPTPFELGLYAREAPPQGISGTDVFAVFLTVVWIGGVAAYFLFGSPTQGSGGPLTTVLTVLAVLMPLALIWIAASAARTARALREEASRLQASIDAMRAAYVEQQQNTAMDLKPAVVEKLDELVQAQRAVDPRQPTFSTSRALASPEDRAAVGPPLDRPAPEEPPQPTLALATPAEHEPISVADFIKALDFPENENDKEGFRTLRRALEDHATERLIRASQDVLTLLSQDGIYMDDLRPDRARPEIWRKFAQGERGRSIAPLGGIHDRSSLVLAAGRMKKDPVFRDAVHHFLRHFDRTFMEFERNASDAEIIDLANTRTSRAFMLLGRVTGTFD